MKNTKGNNYVENEKLVTPLANKHLLAFASIRWKSVIIVLFSVICFAIYIGVTVVQFKAQALLLEDIRDRSYPVQAEYQRAFFTLKTIQSNLETAVITGEMDSLNSANELQETFLSIINNISSYDNQQIPYLENIKVIFNRYYSNSYYLALSIINDDGSLSLNEQGKMNAAEYSTLVQQLEAASVREYEKLNTAITNVSQRANTLVNVGLPVGVITIFLVLLLSFITGRSITQRISEIVTILRNIANHGGDMSARMSVSGNDEMSELAHWFNRFMTKLEKMTNASTSEIKRLAYTDSLTTLPNRRFFNQYLESEIERSARNNTSLAVMFLDLDNFKMVNDTMGHDAGDLLVKEVSARLKTILRPYDIVSVNNEEQSSGKSIVARMGGDEFMLALPNFSDTNDVILLAERVRKSILDPIIINDRELEVGVSIGIAIYPNDGNHYDEIVVKADLAMYEAKNRGKNKYVLYDAQLETTLNRSYNIESMLSTFLINDIDAEFFIYFQPKFEISSGVINGAEALIRWNNATIGAVSPSEFVPIAERKNLIVDLDRWVIKTVCKHLHSWQKQGLDLPPIAINVSAKSIVSPEFCEFILDQLKVNALTHTDIEIEITETSTLNDIDIVASNIANFRKLGIKVAIDDFGAGHASLLLLLHCDVDLLKIDKSFIHEQNQQSIKIIEGIIAMSNVLGIKTVAEGIEDNAQLQILKNIKCDHAQGFYLAKPMSAESFVNFISKSKYNSDPHYKPNHVEKTHEK